MKTIKNIINKTIIVATAIFMLSFSTSPIEKKENKDSNSPVLHYLGKNKNLPVFRLVIANLSNAVYSISVKDDDGAILFEETLSGNTITRTYQLDSENSSLINGTTFQIFNGTNNSTTVYKIKQVTKNVDEINVTEIL